MTVTTKTLVVNAESAIESAVLEWINRRAEEYDNGAIGALKDLFHGGCASGIVSELVYTSDAAAFYSEHQKTIDAMLYEALDDCDSTPDKMFERSGWDKADPLAREDSNRVILAWFGFEETARSLADRAGLEL